MSQSLNHAPAASAAPADNNDWMNDLFVPDNDAPAAPGNDFQGHGSPAPQPAPQPSPGPSPQPAPQHVPNFAPSIEEMVRRQIQQEQQRAPQPAVTPAAPAAPAPIFNPEDIRLTDEERQRLQQSGAGDLLNKVARQAIAEYDSRVGQSYRQQVEAERQERERLARELNGVRTDTANRTLQARFPDLDQLRMTPEWITFIQEPVNTPAGVLPRQAALGMASENGNYSYIDEEIKAFRQRSKPAAQAQASGSADAFGSLSAGAQAPAPVNGGNPVTNPGTRAGVSGGAPAPSLAAINPNRRMMSKSRVEAKLADLAQRIALNPGDKEAKDRYDMLSREAREAWFGGRMA